MKKKYQRIKKIGKGGNGNVYKVKDSKGNFWAKKVLTKVTNKKGYKRFKSEIEILNQLKNKKGIIEIVDYYLPDELENNEPPYYIMPLATPLMEYIKNISNIETFEIIFELCNILEFIHSKDITHRDIKPDNILVIKGKPLLSDFGLANFPKKEKISRINENIGAKWTIAPEMKRVSSSAELKKADIYSFAKTIWMILTKQWQSFDGQYIPYSNISIENFVDLKINKGFLVGNWEYFSIVILNQLLSESTDNNPENRPNANKFKEKLKFWYDTNENYKIRNPIEWKDALNRIFPISISLNSKWNKLKQIHDILKLIFECYDNLNHSFYPTSGGNDFRKVEIINDYLLINDRILIKPKQLIFESIEDLDYSYFIIECQELEPISKNIYKDCEERVYIDNTGKINSSSKVNTKEISRYLRGKFLITRKTSIINKMKGDLDAYNAIQNKCTLDEYKLFVTKLKKNINKEITS